MFYDAQRIVESRNLATKTGIPDEGGGAQSDAGSDALDAERPGQPGAVLREYFDGALGSGDEGA